MNCGRSNWTRLFPRGRRSLAVVLVALLAVGPASRVVPLVVSAVVAQNWVPTNEEEADSHDDKGSRPHVRLQPIPTVIRTPDFVRTPDRLLRPFAPHRYPLSVHALDGPHLRC